MKNEKIICNIVSIMLLLAGTLNIISSVIWSLSSDTSDKWFTRMALGLICFGFFGIMEILSLNTKTK